MHRNLGIAEFNVLGRGRQARAAYQRALRADPSDARVLYEFDQLRRLLAEPPAARLTLLEHNAELVRARDDLTVELLNLLNRLGRHQEALTVLRGRRFHPWEGGEGRVSDQWVRANLRLAQVALYKQEADTAIAHLQAALGRPHNLGEGKHPLTAENEVHYHLALAERRAGHGTRAERWLRRAAAAQGDVQAAPGVFSYWRSCALKALGDEERGASLLDELLRSARTRATEAQRTDYFAASVPNLMILDDDIHRRDRIECGYLESLANAGLGRRRAAIAGLREVLALDPAHPDAAWHLDSLYALRGRRQGRSGE